ncbi:MAG: (d)CMP kinase [Clostridia bacterium]|nr:(d)CMP kinase [Clostridia bacterium]
MLSIAIDGPAGSGKSTVAKAIAEQLKITYLDTGAMYRMVTLNLLNNKTDMDDIKAVEEVLEQIKIEFRPNGLFLNDEDVTTEIRNNIVANHVSQVAAIGIVREKMVAMQREIAKGQAIIMDGRDIGTHVLQDASFKFFLNASVEERAKRRLKDFEAQGIEISLEELIADIQLRDEKDSSREISPLRQADDAILIDTTSMTINEVIQVIIEEIQS